MTTLFRIEMMIVGILFFIFVIRSINRNKLSLKRAASLLVLGVALLLFGIVPRLAESLSSFFGFETTSNFLYFCAILFLLISAIFQSILLSNQEEKIKNLVQEMSILKSQNSKEKK
ncbi:DUF2304 domain-containing protein [Enterococcus sp. LJL128]|uniref:DUF2304 domain-containing protein n=1 Tax=Enterococcus sp. LJL51 TaxID=3416656 RepID=UPI003CEAA4E9